MTKVKLISSDEREFTEELEIAKCFGTIRAIFDNVGMVCIAENAIVPVPYVTSEILRKCLNWVKQHKYKYPIDNSAVKTVAVDDDKKQINSNNSNNDNDDDNDDNDDDDDDKTNNEMKLNKVIKKNNQIDYKQLKTIVEELTENSATNQSTSSTSTSTSISSIGSSLSSLSIEDNEDVCNGNDDDDCDDCDDELKSSVIPITSSEPRNTSDSTAADDGDSAAAATAAAAAAAAAKWEKQFFTETIVTLIEIIKASDFLNIPDLLDASCAAIAHRLQGKSVNGIRKSLAIKSNSRGGAVKSKWQT